MSTTLKCPVCGKEHASSAAKYDCDNCGFTNAFVRFFVTKDGEIAWNNALQHAKQDWTKKQTEKQNASRLFWLGNNAFAIGNKDTKAVSIILGTGMIQTERNAIDFSSSERNYAVLYEFGKVTVFGEDNSFGQKNTSTWKGIQSVLAAPNCTYGISRSGDIVYAGSLFSQDLLAWKNLKQLRASDDLIAGLDADGKVLVAEGAAVSEHFRAVSSWSNIKDIRLSRDCIIGLTPDGRVLFDGKEDDVRREVTSWTDIRAIAMDNVYAYGLSADGQMHIAGKCKAFLDRGRSESAGWTDIQCISANRAGIGALRKNGELLFAGSIEGDLTRMKAAWSTYDRRTVNIT